jgi:hypothetical protein
VELRPLACDERVLGAQELISGVPLPLASIKACTSAKSR